MTTIYSAIPPLLATPSAPGWNGSAEDFEVEVALSDATVRRMAHRIPDQVSELHELSLSELVGFAQILHQTRTERGFPGPVRVHAGGLHPHADDLFYIPHLFATTSQTDKPCVAWERADETRVEAAVGADIRVIRMWVSRLPELVNLASRSPISRSVGSSTTRPTW